MKLRHIFFVLLVFTFSNCSKNNDTVDSPTQIPSGFTEDFDNQQHLDSFWEDASQNNSPMNYQLDSGNFKITTRANEVDRVKIKTITEDFGLGSYTWRIYTEERTIADQNSIGAFLYNSDFHEIDFEIGSGKLTERSNLMAEDDELLVYCTSQNFPFISEPFKIKHNMWHEFKIELSLNETTQNYIVKWFVDDNLLQTLSLEYGTEKLFGVYCSLENLSFIGDNLPNQAYSTMFDYFKHEEQF